MKKIALLFCGQGSQYIGMSKKLCSDFEAANRVFEEANDVLSFDLKKLCFEGNIEELTDTYNAQPAILAASVAAFNVYMQEGGIEPSYLAGHSLGEFSALVCGGVLKLSDALRVVRCRGKLMGKAEDDVKGVMAAVGGIDPYRLEEICRESSTEKNQVVIACYNAREQLVVSGHLDAVNAAKKKVEALGGQFTLLKVSIASHSPLMAHKASEFKEELSKYSFNQQKYPIISNVTAYPYKDKQEMLENLKQQLVKPVQWIATMNYLKRNNVTLAIEMGPGTVLKRLAYQNIKHITAFSYDKPEDVKELERMIASRDKAYSLVQRCVCAAISAPNKNFDEEEYRVGVLEPYRQILKMQLELEQKGLQPSMEQMEDSLTMLKSVLTTKKITAEKQLRKFKQILCDTSTYDLFKQWTTIS